MIIVYSSKNCSKCDVVKNILTNHNIKFDCKYMEKLTKNEFVSILNEAAENRITTLPIIYDNEKKCIVELTELIGV